MAAMASGSEVNNVYNVLLKFYPQIDRRILKAVAIENHDNIDEAFSVVISDILPNVPAVKSLDENVHTQLGAGSDSGLHNSFAGPELQLVQEAVAPPSKSELAPEHDGTSVTPVADADLIAKKFLDEVSKISDADQLISIGKGLAHHLNIVPEQINNIASVDEKLGDAYEMGNSSRGQSYSSLIANEESILPTALAPISASFVSPEVTDLAPGEGKGLEEVLDFEPDSDSCMAISWDERDIQVEQNSNSDYELQQEEFSTDWFYESANAIVSLPSQSIKIELLESSIDEAKNSKENLFTSVEAVMNTMREVEIREKAAEKAKEVASKGGVEILAQAEELRKMLQKGKEANDMHAGEVYGERSILATEAKELQSRLVSLSEERDEALCILDEMRSSLEMRLAAADEEIRKAEEEVLQKENAAKMQLDEQESIMDKIVQESKLLQLEAAENSKLSEFLVNRGRIVDTLQGEIGVICQDVKSLKAKFDQRCPLSESFSSGDTTCMLASSGSSSKKSLSSLVIPDQQVPSESPPTELEGDGWEFLA